MEHQGEMGKISDGPPQCINSIVYTWDKVFKNGPSKICGRQSFKNFAWYILEYLDQYDLAALTPYQT